MERKEIYDIGDFNKVIGKYFSEGKEVNFSYGLRPSGTIHLGNLTTLALASELVNKAGPHLSNLTLSILDLDLPDVQDWNFPNAKYVRHYKDLPCEGYVSLSEKVKVQISDFMEKLNDEINVPFKIAFLSDLQKDSRYRKGLVKILENEEARDLMNPFNQSERIEVYPLCKKCGTSYTNSIKGKINTYENHIIHTHCSNPSCDVKDYSVNVLDPSIDISVGTLISALRDLSSPVADAHVYGGDYSFPHGRTRESKVSKIKKLMDIADPKKNLDFLVGPTIFAKGREKMSKSLHNGLDYDHLKKLFGDDYVKRILDFTWKILEREYSVVDFAVVQENLLG